MSMCVSVDLQLPAVRPKKLMHMSKPQKTVSRAYGGSRCARCVRERQVPLSYLPTILVCTVYSVLPSLKQWGTAPHCFSEHLLFLWALCEIFLVLCYFCWSFWAKKTNLTIVMACKSRHSTLTEIFEPVETVVCGCGSCYRNACE